MTYARLMFYLNLGMFGYGIPITIWAPNNTYRLLSFAVAMLNLLAAYLLVERAFSREEDKND